MEHLKRMKEKLHKELKEFDKKDDLSMGDVTTIHMLTDTIKNIDKICMLEEEGGYSQAVDRDGRMMPHYNQGGRSYNDGGYSQRRDSRGRYSRDDGEKMRIVKELEQMRNLFNDDEWDMIEDIVHRIKGAA
jgi:hypothetical protein